jgi:hypothetical protein
VVDDNTIQALSPAVSPPSPTSRNVTVTTLGGTSFDTAIFVYAAQPAVQAISPTSGSTAGGMTVTIDVDGSAFQNGVTGVFFGSTPAASFTQPIISFPNFTLTAVSPPGTGTVDVAITNPGGTSATTTADLYTYRAPPSVTSLSPTSGLPGALVTIHGNNFTGATQVCFGQTCTSAANPPVVLDDNTITANVPSSPFEGSTVDVTVTTPAGTSPTSPSDLFTLL